MKNNSYKQYLKVATKIGFKKIDPSKAKREKLADIVRVCEGGRLKLGNVESHNPQQFCTQTADQGSPNDETF